MNAAQLDKQLAAQDAYRAAEARGKTHDEATAAAVAAVKRKHAEQTLRSVGLHGEELETALRNMGH